MGARRGQSRPPALHPRASVCPHAATSRLRSASASTDATPIACMWEPIAASRSATTPVPPGPSSTRRRMIQRPTCGMWSRTTGRSSISAATTGTFARSMPGQRGRLAVDCRPAFARSRLLPTSATWCLRPSAQTPGRPTTAAAAGFGSARPIRVARGGSPSSTRIRARWRARRSRRSISGTAMSGCIAPAVAATRPAGGSVALWQLPVRCCLRRRRPDGMAPSHEAPVVMMMWRLLCLRPGLATTPALSFSRRMVVFISTPRRRARIATAHFGSNRMSRRMRLAVGAGRFQSARRARRRPLFRQPG